MDTITVEDLTAADLLDVYNNIVEVPLGRFPNKTAAVNELKREMAAQGITLADAADGVILRRDYAAVSAQKKSKPGSRNRAAKPIPDCVDQTRAERYANMRDGTLCELTGKPLGRRRSARMADGRVALKSAVRAHLKDQ